MNESLLPPEGAVIEVKLFDAPARQYLVVRVEGQTVYLLDDPETIPDQSAWKS